MAGGSSALSSSTEASTSNGWILHYMGNLLIAVPTQKEVEGAHDSIVAAIQDADLKFPPPKYKKRRHGNI